MQLDATYYINFSDDSVDNLQFIPEFFQLCDMRKPSCSVFGITAFCKETFLANLPK